VQMSKWLFLLVFPQSYFLT